MAGQEQKSGLENTLFSLMERETAANFDQTGLLTLISLVNLLGILDLARLRFNFREEK